MRNKTASPDLVTSYLTSGVERIPVAALTISNPLRRSLNPQTGVASLLCYLCLALSPDEGDLQHAASYAQRGERTGRGSAATASQKRSQWRGLTPPAENGVVFTPSSHIKQQCYAMRLTPTYYLNIRLNFPFVRMIKTHDFTKPLLRKQGLVGFHWCTVASFKPRSQFRF